MCKMRAIDDYIMHFWGFQLKLCFHFGMPSNEFHVKSFESLSIIFDTHTHTHMPFTIYLRICRCSTALGRNSQFSHSKLNVADVYWKLEIENNKSRAISHLCLFIAIKEIWAVCHQSKQHSDEHRNRKKKLIFQFLYLLKLILFLKENRQNPCLMEMGFLSKKINKKLLQIKAKQMEFCSLWWQRPKQKI